MIIPGSIAYVTSLWAIKVALVNIEPFPDYAKADIPFQGHILQENRSKDEIANSLQRCSWCFGSNMGCYIFRHHISMLSNR